MTTKTYDKDPLGILGDEPTNDPLGILEPTVKKKDGGIVSSPTSSESPSQEDKRLFGYRTLFKDTNEEKGKFIKPLPVPKTIESGVKQDKKKDTGVAGRLFNGLVELVSKTAGGIADASNTITDIGGELLDKAQGTEGFSKYRKEAQPLRLPEGKDVRADIEGKLKVNTEYEAPTFDVTDGVQASDIESLAVQAPEQLAGMLMGLVTGGQSYFYQSVSDNSKELDKIPEAAKLSAGEKFGYLYIQGAVQAALEKFSIDKMFKSTGLSKKAADKITNEIIDEFAKKGKKATAKEIEDLAFKKASSFATKAKNVGIKGGVSGVVEGVTEGAQTGASEGNKIALNKITGKKIFDEKDIVTNLAKNVINSAVQGKVIGGVVGGGVGALQNTNKAIRSKIAQAQSPEDFQKLQGEIAQQVELGNITQEEAEAANITAQQYAEIAAKIPETVDAERKYALMGGIEQREGLKNEIAEVNSELGYLDEAFHEEPLARIDLLKAKLEQTNDYIDGIVSGKKTTYKKEGDQYFKTDGKGEVSQISKEHYDAGVAVREEEAAKNKKPEINPQDQKTFTFTHDEDVPAELENVKPIHVQEISTPEGNKVEVTYSGEQLIKAGLAKVVEVQEEPITFTEQEQDALKGIQEGDFKGTGVSTWTNIIQDPNASNKDKKQALKELYEQLTAKGTEAVVGEALGKKADLIYDLNYEAPTESAELQKALSPMETQAVEQSEGAAENVVPSTFENVESTSKALHENNLVKELINSHDLGKEMYDRLPSSDDYSKKNKELYKSMWDGEITREEYKRIIDEEYSKLQKKKADFISEEYHKAKKDGSNPALVQSVEKLLTPQQQTSKGGNVVPSTLKDEPKKLTLKLSGKFANTEAADNAIKEVYELGEINQFNEKQVVIDGVKINAERDGGKIWLKEISAIEQGKGNGTKVLNKIKDVADKNNVDIVLHPTAIKNTSEADLIKWYKKNGFEDYTQGRLIYKSKVAQTENTTGLVPTTESNSSLEEIGDAGASKQQTSNETKQPEGGTPTQPPPTDQGKGVEPPPAGTPPVEEGKGDKDKGNKALANRLVDAEKVPEAAKQGIREKGLSYEPQSQEEAQKLANAIIDEVGIDEAVLRARAQEFGGDVNTLVQTQALNRLAEMSEKETEPDKKLEHDLKFAEIGIQLDEWLRKQGRGISALNYFYKKSPLGMQIVENTRRKQDFEEWSKPKDKSWKEFFDEMMKEPEFESLVKEEVKKERAEERKAKKDKVHKSIDDLAKKWADKLKPKGGNEDIQKQGIGIDEIMKAATTAIKAAYDAGEAVAKIVQDAINYISEQIGHDQWGTEDFRAEWEQKLRDKAAKKALTDEEVKARVLDRFKNKLKGLSDSQKEEVVRKSFKKIVESGGLDYQEFKDIISDITGRGPMSEEEATKLKDLVTAINSVEDAAVEARKTRTAGALKKFKEQQLKAGKASKDLNKLLYNKPNVIKRLTSIMQLNTLGIPALVNNPIYNIWNQTTLRFPIGVVNTLVDGTISAISKVMGREYTSETSLISLDKYWLRTQKEFFSKLGLGLKEGGLQFVTGLDRQDYTQKELYGQQIRPLSSAKDLFLWATGKKPLSGAQIVDKGLQASPIGWIAEGIARVLNLGDKPQRFAAEGAQAAAFSKALGISDVDYKLFIEFPREEAYRQFIAKGLSEAEAGKKADYIRDTIVKEGQRSTFQQDNVLNDILNKIFGGEQSGAGSLAKAVAVSPYVKIPSNAFWSYFNLVNPEVALLQAAYYGTKAAARAKNPNARFPYDKSGASAAKDLHEAKYWFAHAAVGIAMRSVVTSMVLAGIFRSSNDDDDTKKERQGEQNFEAQGTINVTKLNAWLRGDDPSKIKGGLLVSNRWGGHWGTVGNTVAKRYENMTPEQKENGDSYFNMLMGNLELSSLKEMEQGVFGNTSALLSAAQNPDYFLRGWGVNTLNMFTNIVHPAAFAQISRAQIPYVSQTKADTFGEQIKNSMLQRSSWLRAATGANPTAKIGIWGDKIDRPDNVAMRLFGFSNVNKDAFARPIYDDVVRTGDIGYFPPAVPPRLNNQKLNTEQTLKLEEYVGQARKGYIAPYVNDQAIIEGFDVKYSQLSDDDKKYMLQYLYGKGKDDGEERFYNDYPQFRPAEVEKDYEAEQQKSIFKLLQKYK